MRFGPASIPRLEQTTLDGQVLRFTAAVSVAVGILFGLAPALQGARTSAQSALKEAGTRVSMGPGAVALARCWSSASSRWRYWPRPPPRS